MSLPTHLRLAVLALVATLLSALTLHPLLDGPGWVAPVIVVTVVITLTGIALRQVTRLWPVVALVQLAVLTVTVCALFARDSALFGVIPTAAAVERLGRVLTEGFTLIGQSAAPVPTDPGMVLLVTAGVAVIAFAVDLIAASLERPAAAGLPLLAIYCVPAAVLPDGLSWPYFVLAALGYLVLVASDAADRAQAWGRVLGGGPDGVQHSSGGPLNGGRRVAAVSLAAAVLIPLITPGVGEKLLSDGDGPGEGRGSGKISVINPILTLRQNLNARSDTPVITYRTSVKTPEPLRIATDDTFDGERWSPSTGRIFRKQRVQDGLPPAPGLGPEVAAAAQTHQTSISIGNLSQTYLPLPYPTTVVTIDGEWLWEANTLNVVGDGQRTQNTDYTATHLQIAPTAQQLESAPPPTREVLDRYATLPSSLPVQIRTIADQVAGQGSAFRQALQLQDYLRVSGGFTYNPQVSGVGSDDSGEDAVLAFLRGKQGYCVQFASAMAVMARSLGIPARVGVGFLPGSANGDGSYTITVRDAHAWPELYFDGVGWVRFEPTPADRVPTLPSYADAQVREEPGAAPTPSASASAQPQAGASSQAVTPPRDAQNSPATADEPWWSVVPWRLLAALAALAVLGLAPSAAARWRRRRRWARTDSAREAAEAAWDDLRERLADLSVRWARSWTPRAVLSRLTSEHGLAGQDRAALERLVTDLESARYAPPGEASGRGHDQIRQDAEQVVAAVAAGLTPAQRRRARWFPRSGVAVLTGARRRAADLASPADGLGSTDESTKETSQGSALGRAVRERVAQRR